MKRAALGVLAALVIAGPAAAQPARPAPTPATPPAGSVGGMGDVNIYPKRVVIDDRSRIASVGLFNRTAADGEYDIILSELVMTPAGDLVDPQQVTDPALAARMKSAAGLLRYSPRKVRLPGNQAQTVRLMARIPPDLPPGEYRAHFNAISVPQPAGEGSIEAAAAPQAPNAIGVEIVPRFGISIPVIVRVGQTTLTTGLRDLRVVTATDRSPAIALAITREGTRSAFGDVTVTGKGGKVVAMLKGIGVYPEIAQRQVVMRIDAEVDPALYAPGARLVATYTDDDVRPGQTLARQEFVVP